MPVCLVGGLVKTCTKCGEEKPLDEFYKHKSYKDGHQTSCKPCFSAQVNARRLERVYGITVAQFDEMYERQGGKCFICEKEEATHVDHCHDSGDVRALLCHGCNSAIGLFKEDADVMIAGAMYILMHQGAYDVHS